MTQPLNKDDLMGLTFAEIRAGYAAIFGKPSRCPNKGWMVNEMVAATALGARPSATAVSAASATPPLDTPPPAPEQAPKSIAASLAVAEPAGIAPPIATTRDPPPQLPVPDVAAPIDPPPANVASPEDDIVYDLVSDDDDDEEQLAETERAPTVPPSPPVPAAPKSGTQVAGRSPSERPRGAGDVGSAAFRRADFRGMSAEALQAEYLRVVGRRTTSRDGRYLRWKITEAARGRVTVGPIIPPERRDRPEAKTGRTLPLMLPDAAILALDESWWRHGFTTRMAFIRLAIRDALLALGENECAQHFPEARRSQRRRGAEPPRIEPSPDSDGSR